MIYQLHNSGLGDHWASLSLLASMSIRTGQHVGYTAALPAKRARAHEIIRLLDLPDAAYLVQYVDPPESQLRLLDGFHVWSTPYYPTRLRWSSGRDARSPGYVCAHFSGESSGDLKNPSIAEQTSILSWVARQGLGLHLLGNPAEPLGSVVDKLASCALFVGCDSGFSHIAHSVGCPTYLLEYDLPVVTCHRHKSYVLCRGAAEFAHQADRWLDLRRYLRSLIPPA